MKAPLQTGKVCLENERMASRHVLLPRVGGGGGGGCRSAVLADGLLPRHACRLTRESLRCVPGTPARRIRVEDEHAKAVERKRLPMTLDNCVMTIAYDDGDVYRKYFR